MEESKISEEVTVTPIIRDLERLFNRFIQLIWKFIKLIFSGFGFIINSVLKNFILFIVVIALGGLMGFLSINWFPRMYKSSMVVKINVDSKAQLENDAAYINALISSKDTEVLGNLLQVTPEEAGTIIECSVKSDPTYLEKINALNQLYLSTDTSLLAKLNYKELLASEDSELSVKFKVSFTASDHKIFSKLEAPFLAFISRSEELNKLLAISTKTLHFQRDIYAKELVKLDTLSKVMNLAMVEQAKNGENSGSTTNLVLGETNTKNNITALDIQDRYLYYANKISKLDLRLHENEKCYFVSAHINPYGEKTGFGRLARTMMGALLFFSFTILIILLLNWRKTTR
ncbi:hypothetical protein [Crocinitomix catalasitica]|uniref:hypothetical protein n=1 Tax=Crocinitomix catalasitica TaxID=184607 RepID=UPI00048334E7|nr:hypothetical protein [Crocinitomix catalasitica]